MHPLLENDHQKLIDLLDALDKVVLTGDGVNQVNKYIGDFAELAKKEFRNEEEIMETRKYTDIVSHKKEHADLLEKLAVIKNKLDSGHTPFGRTYMQSLRRWLEAHLVSTDNKLDQFLYQANGDSNKSDHSEISD